jgi:hypothetical protein
VLSCLLKRPRGLMTLPIAEFIALSAPRAGIGHPGGAVVWAVRVH